MYGKMENITQQKWRCFGKSVRGTYHWRSELRNQDAIQWYPGHPETGVGLPVILADQTVMAVLRVSVVIKGLSLRFQQQFGSFKSFSWRLKTVTLISPHLKMEQKGYYHRD